jgi:hypothetical protein
MDNNFVVIVKQAAYGEWNQFRELSECSESWEARISMMSPVNFTDIIINARTRLTDIGMDVIKMKYQDIHPYLNDSDRLQLMPTMDLHRFFSDSLIPNNDQLVRELDHYEMVYHMFVTKVSKSSSISVGDAASRVGTGTAAGIALGLMLGPIGVVVGGIAGTLFSSNKAENELTNELKIYAHDLDNAYNRLMDSVNITLEEMVKNMLNNIDKYCVLLE